MNGKNRSKKNRKSGHTCLKSQKKYESTKLNRNYKYDAAHPQYNLIYWTTCAKQYCEYHKKN